MGKLTDNLITVTLYEKKQTGVDALNNPIYEEFPEEVGGVLVGSPTTDDVTSSNQLYGKKLEYVLGIPVGDWHEWENRRVDFFGKSFETFGEVMTGIPELIPLGRQCNVMVCRYGGI